MYLHNGYAALLRATKAMFLESCDQMEKMTVFHASLSP